ncbi:MAG: hypothetical protein ACFFCV_18765 [Promethearchaeota archaeon]
MIGQNDIENPSILPEIREKNGVEYSIPFPQKIVDRMDLFISRLKTSYENLFDYLLENHLYEILNDIRGKEYSLISFLHFGIDEIFNDDDEYDDDLEGELPDTPEIKTKNISVEISRKINTTIKRICEEIHNIPELFISKAIELQFANIGDRIYAGYYSDIEYFCNIPKIKQALEDFFKSDTTEPSNPDKDKTENKKGDDTNDVNQFNGINKLLENEDVNTNE